LRCTGCKHLNPGRARFCEACGKALPATLVDAPRPKGVVKAVLVEYLGADDTGRLHPLKLGRSAAGRAADQDVILRDPRVSAQHGFFVVEPSRTLFMDVSSNGTHVDGALVHGDSVELEQGSVLKLGDTHLVVLLVRPRGAS
jgi:hypothetical protein